MPLTPTRERDMLPLEQYAALGDGRSVAVVGADGSVDWWCVPNLDSPPLFDRMLDPASGRFSVAPGEPFTVTRRYRPDSNVLEQVFTTANGSARLTDSLNSGISGRLPWCELARPVEGLSGSVAFDIVMRPSRCLDQAQSWRESSPHGEAFALLGDHDAAVRQMDGMLAATGMNLGLLCEQLDLDGHMLGNVTQALSHLALIQAAAAINQSGGV